MKFANICKKNFRQGEILSFSSETNQSQAKNITQNDGFWSTELHNADVKDHIIIDYNEKILLNFVELFSSPSKQAFPKSYRIEISNDSEIWEQIFIEDHFEMDEDSYVVHLPLLEMQYLKIIILSHGYNVNQIYSEIGKIETGIFGPEHISVSSYTDGQPLEYLFTENQRDFWQSEIKPQSSEESINIDLGSSYNINKIILGTTTTGFPEHFHAEGSIDGSLWTPLFEERDFKYEQNMSYSWNIDLTPCRFIRFTGQSIAITKGRYGMQINRFDIFGVKYQRDHTHNIGDITPSATLFQPGIVKLARDGEETMGTAVQGSDRRLRDATTIFKGIVQLAEDGDDKNGVVQADDARLKDATELKAGITRLAYDRETKKGTAVQGSDSRLKEATEENFGIVKICQDGINSDHGVVRGNDSRLQLATTEGFGIVKLAENGSSEHGSVVQSDDKRLRDATIHYDGIVTLAEDGGIKENTVVQATDKRLKKATTQHGGIVELAENGESAKGLVVQSDDKRLKDATTTSKGIVELAEDGEDREGVTVQGHDKRLKDATTETKGIVELAENGEDYPGVVVQGNDLRLKDATEVSKGIMRYAKDGEKSELAAVQGNDKRLKNATTVSKGIVELAEDGEENEGVAVQGHDKRLKDATTETKGIVELAENGEERAGVAVQGHDKRLKDATEENIGILRFAQDGETSPWAAVQSNDKRLKNATTVSKGIVELAEDGEDAEGVAIQGNDKRLKNATIVSKGIVELAEDGEDAEGVVIQGNDSRIKKATEENFGITKLAPDGEKRHGHVVQAQDKRLYDKRDPLDHNHNYAPVDHSFDSHKGTISITDKKNETFTGITPPSDDSAIIYGKNNSNKNSSIGIAGITASQSEKNIKSYGIVGHSQHIGIRGQSTGGDDFSGCGVLGISRNGVGGIFASEHNVSLKVDGYGEINTTDNSLNLIGNGDALHVSGKSVFDGMIDIQNTKDTKDFPVNIVEYFVVNETEFISPGDILMTSEEGQCILEKSHLEYNKTVIGIVSGNPVIKINNAGTKEKVYPVALGGKVFCKVDARLNPINPGDLIVSSSTPGCGMKGTVDSFDKIGTVLGKALDSIQEGIGIIPIYIMPQ